MELVTYLNKQSLPFPKCIDSERVFKYLSTNADNSQVAQAIDECYDLVKSASSPKVVYKVISEIPPELVVGSDIEKHLSGCSGLVVFALTLGIECDKLITKLAHTDIFKQVVCDAVSSVLVETICEQFEADLKAQFEERKIYATSSYAPGYGDYPLEMLKTFLQIIDGSKMIGVNLTTSGFMTPRKSICAVIGLSDSPVTGFRAGCEHCKMQDNCKLKKEGKTCVR